LRQVLVEAAHVAAKTKQTYLAAQYKPIPRVDGIEPSDDPLLELRAAVYLLSGRRRRQAPEPSGRVLTTGQG
jgi:catalase